MLWSCVGDTIGFFFTPDSRLMGFHNGKRAFEFPLEKRDLPYDLKIPIFIWVAAHARHEEVEFVQKPNIPAECLKYKGVPKMK